MTPGTAQAMQPEVDDTPAPETWASVPPEDRSLQNDLKDLAEVARTYAEAEAEFQKARASYAGGAIKGLALLGVGAALAVFFALVALVVGLVIALTPEIGPWGATAVVTGVLLVVAFVCAHMLKTRARRMMQVLSNAEGE